MVWDPCSYIPPHTRAHVLATDTGMRFTNPPAELLGCRAGPDVWVHDEYPSMVYWCHEHWQQNAWHQDRGSQLFWNAWSTEQGTSTQTTGSPQRWQELVSAATSDVHPAPRFNLQPYGGFWKVGALSSTPSLCSGLRWYCVESRGDMSQLLTLSTLKRVGPCYQFSESQRQVKSPTS